MDTAENKAPELDTQNDHKLKSGYTFWFYKRSGARTSQSYAKNLTKIGTFNTAEGFWRYYNHLIRPNDLPNTSDYHLFKEGILPMWEDDANKKGGKWIVRLRKGLVSKYWEDLLLAVIGGQFAADSEVCGIIVSIRFQEDIISVWNKNSEDKKAKAEIYETLKTVLALPMDTSMEYKAHDDSIRDSSSFLNTDQFADDKEGDAEGGREEGETSAETAEGEEQGTPAPTDT